MSNRLVRFLYVLVIGLLFVAFIGFGLATFYKAPKAPEYPVELSYPVKTDSSADVESLATQRKYNDQQKAYQTEMSRYNLYASVILIAVAVLVLAVSMLGLEKVEVIGDGLTLGGVFTLLYGLGRGMAVENDIFRFIAVTAGLVIILILTYLKFIRHAPTGITTPS
ncbi:MAG: hypothetical protein Q7K33_00235 [Candidatus Berkelbacteria bacterium]|nr:hypothetical protein [Candidatus Berkelbacteria bacterium]